MIWPFTVIADLRQYIYKLEDEFDAANEHADTLEEKIKQLEATLAETQAALIAALKNDTAKDPKTGKFTKKAKDV